MKFGVIGGNGVAATNRLLEMIERKITLQGAFRDAHHPDMLIAQATNVPSRSMYLEGKGESFIPQYVELAKAFKVQGCTHVCMCCNTAHYALHEIENESGIKFINLLDEVANKVRKTGVPAVELWVSDGARKFDIYGESFRRNAPNTKILYPSESRQSFVTKLICAVKTKARFLSSDADDHPRAILKTLLAGAQAPVVLGCTDIRMAYQDGEDLDARIIVDSLECLADKIVELFLM